MLEVFINTILYVREVYPAAIFRKRKMYSTAVYASIYPKLNDYLVKVLTTAHNLKKQNKLIKLELVIYKSCAGHTARRNEQILEKYVFEVDAEATNDWKNSDSTRSPDQYLIEFEEDVRTALFQFEKMAKTLKRLDCVADGEDCCFRVELVTTESAFIELTNKMNNTNEVKFKSILFWTSISLNFTQFLEFSMDSGLESRAAPQKCVAHSADSQNPFR